MKPAEKYRAWKAHRPEKPIFRTILFSMMAVLLAEVILLSTGIGLTNVSGRLNQNAKQIVNMQVRNRASYLQDMLIKAQELTDISTTINNLTQQMLQDGTISLDTMDQSSEAADPLMEAAAPYLVSALRARPVTGIFLVINTHDLAEKKVGSPMPSRIDVIIVSTSVKNRCPPASETMPLASFRPMPVSVTEPITRPAQAQAAATPIATLERRLSFII